MKAIRRCLFLKLPLLLLLLLLVPAEGWARDIVSYRQVNRQALREYQQPVRPGTDGSHPFWNAFAPKFLFAPAFDFPDAPGAGGYLFRASDGKGGLWQMRARTPRADLAPIWKELPAGSRISLTVIALDAKGRQTADTVGRRQFLRDYPFCGPYNMPARPYKEAALKAMLYVHFLPAIHAWVDHTEPDMGYPHNTYACKIMGSTLRNEALVAHFFPELRDEALTMARHVAAFLRTISQPPGTPLAYFPPTYYGGLIASSLAENQNKTMCMEAITVAQGLLDLYRESGEREYYDWALGIADTYLRLQRPDGSLPIKLDLTTGEPVNDACAMLHPLLRFFERLHDEFGLTAYEEGRLRAQRWMSNVCVPRFDMTGQFEDCSVLGLQPYENLTNCTAAPYASYLFERPEATQADLRDAEDLLRLSEDQFVHWDVNPRSDGIRPHATPCVFEQYKYQMSVDNSAANVAAAFLAKHQRTGDRLALAKAIALTNTITLVQNANNGLIPTTWENRRNVAAPMSFWLNCSVSSTLILLRMSDAIDHTHLTAGLHLKE